MHPGSTCKQCVAPAVSTDCRDIDRHHANNKSKLGDAPTALPSPLLRYPASIGHNGNTNCRKSIQGFGT
ncbi:unnamed protein product [Leptosia nina]|uniref:Uncharacterized protein n=1 Tax=Leptosia nina TaxID=320188 RepID=A0AAV1JSA5_9NEOP